MAADSIKEYQRKRDFRKTSEPRGNHKGSNDRPIFVIQKHAASSLHYDFRIEVNGVLKSWAVPKGPSTDPRERRLAVPTEDHPMEYADFEGTIPKEEYGGGAVIVWDRGTYVPLQKEGDEGPVSMEESLADGHVTISLNGKKLKGGYALIRTGKSGEKRWLLVKMDDDEADARRNPVSTEPQSVLSGKTVEEIAEE